MLIPILLLSSIFVAIAFIVNENNACQLLSGYNTMSEEERQNFDITSYLRFFRKFHIYLGISLLFISVALHQFVNSDWSGIFLGTYPILAYVYFIWKGNGFSQETTKKQKLTTYIAMGVMLALFVLIAVEFKNSLKDNQIIVGPNQIEITGEYGTQIKIADIKSVQLVDKLPEITSKINGIALENTTKGYFVTASGEKVKLLINSAGNSYLLIITKDNQKIYYASEQESGNDIYKHLHKFISH